MTATSYVVLDNDDLGANKIFRAATASALDTNPVSIAQRGTGAPWLNGVGAIATLTSGSGNYTVPAGVYRMKVTCVGSGGGGGATLNGSGGGSTTFGSLTGGGGGAGLLVGTDGSGGSASGGDINLSGITGGSPAYFSTLGSGGDGSGGGGNGGSGAVCIGVVAAEPGDVIAYAVGSGGAGGSGGGVAGSAGIIIIEY
jgi:hypothetical protein